MRLQQTVSEDSAIIYRTLPSADSVAGLEDTSHYSVLQPTGESHLHTTPITRRKKSFVATATTILLALLSWSGLIAIVYLTYSSLVLDIPFPLLQVKYAIGGFSIVALPLLFPLQHQKARRYLMTIISMLAIIGISWIPNDSTRHQYFVSYEVIRNGMTVPEVQQLLGNHYRLEEVPHLTYPANYTGTIHVLSHSPSEGDYNLDNMWIEFVNGRVTNKSCMVD